MASNHKQALHQNLNLWSRSRFATRFGGTILIQLQSNHAKISSDFAKDMVLVKGSILVRNTFSTKLERSKYFFQAWQVGQM